MSTTTQNSPSAAPKIAARPSSRWLHGRHSFSFGRYYDPNNLGYRSLRVINDDIIEPASGFGEHGHDNMEILTWVLEGTLHHRDSTGSDGDLRPGELQAMTAGRGIRHSEVNDSPTERVHLLQIWIEPDTLHLQPSYGQKSIPGRRPPRQMANAGQPRRPRRLDADSPGRDPQRRRFEQRSANRAQLGANRHAYVHVAFGSVHVGDTTLKSGDAITFSWPGT